MTYTISVDYCEALYSANALKARIDHLRAYLAKNPRTPMARKLRPELSALESVRVQLEQRIDEHAARVRTSIQKASAS